MGAWQRCLPGVIRWNTSPKFVIHWPMCCYIRFHNAVVGPYFHIFRRKCLSGTEQRGHLNKTARASVNYMRQSYVLEFNNEVEHHCCKICYCAPTTMHTYLGIVASLSTKTDSVVIHHHPSHHIAKLYSYSALQLFSAMVLSSPGLLWSSKHPSWQRKVPLHGQHYVYPLNLARVTHGFP